MALADVIRVSLGRLMVGHFHTTFPASFPTELQGHIWNLDPEVFLEPSSLPTVPSWVRTPQAINV